jgi:hypothetical protein
VGALRAEALLGLCARDVILVPPFEAAAVSMPRCPRCSADLGAPLNGTMATACSGRMNLIDFIAKSARSFVPSGSSSS